MTENRYNENDPGFLASRNIDGDLSVDERRWLDAELQASPTLREEAEQLCDVAGLLRDWSRTSPQVDWDAHAALVQAHVESEIVDDSTQKLDATLSRWGAAVPAFDDRDFTARVLRKIGRQRRTPAYATILRWGMPLAAAAVFAFMITAVFWDAQPDIGSPARSLVQIGPPSESLVTAFSVDARADVSFARPVETEEPAEVDGIGLLTLGASMAPRGFSDGAPL